MIYIWFIILIGIVILIIWISINHKDVAMHPLFVTAMVIILYVIPIHLFDVRNDKFNRPLKENMEVHYKNGIPVDTLYTYE